MVPRDLYTLLGLFNIQKLRVTVRHADINRQLVNVCFVEIITQSKSIYVLAEGAPE